MGEAKWLACTEPQSMLSFLEGKASDRKLRLFAAVCCRRVWPLLIHEESKTSIEAARSGTCRWGCSTNPASPTPGPRRATSESFGTRPARKQTRPKRRRRPGRSAVAPLPRDIPGRCRMLLPRATSGTRARRGGRSPSVGCRPPRPLRQSFSSRDRNRPGLAGPLVIQAWQRWHPST